MVGVGGPWQARRGPFPEFCLLWYSHQGSTMSGQYCQLPRSLLGLLIPSC